MPKIAHEMLIIRGRNLAELCNRRCASFLSLKMRRIRKELVSCLEEGEVERQKFLEEFSAKNGDGSRKTVTWQDNNQPNDAGAERVVFEDRAAFEEAMAGLAKTEFVISEYITAADIEDERHPVGFAVSADELDGLGPLFVDPQESKPKAKKPPVEAV